MDALDQFIPMPSGQPWMLKAQAGLINTLSGNVGYEVRDGYVIFTEDITQTLGINYVDMQLVVMDFEKYSDFDLLPLPADLAAKIVTEAFKILSNQFPPDKKVDSVSEEQFKR